MLEEEYQPRRILPPHLRPAPEPQPRFEYTIRAAEESDLPHIREIYNHYVLNSTVTFDEKPMTLAELRRKYAKLEKLHMPFIVAVSPGGRSSATPTSTRGRRRPRTGSRWRTLSTSAPPRRARASARC